MFKRLSFLQAALLIFLIFQGGAIYWYVSTFDQRVARTECLRFIQAWSRTEVRPLAMRSWPVYEYRDRMWLVQAAYQRDGVTGYQWCRLVESYRGKMNVQTLSNRYDDVRQLLETK